MMNQDEDISLTNLRNDSQYDLLKKVRSNVFNNEDEEPIDDSPYDSIDLKCTYIEDPDDIKQFKPNENLSFYSVNIQSLPSKFAEFKEQLTTFKYPFDIICVQEIWRIHDDDLYNLPGYTFVYKCRSNNMQGGGVGIYVKEDYTFSIIPQYSIFLEKIIETLFIEVELCNKKKVIISSVYRPNGVHPNLTSTQQLDQFTELFTNILAEISSTNKTAYIMGDMNIDLLKCDVHNKTSLFIESCFSNGFLQLVTKPTRCYNRSATLIDHFLTNSQLNGITCGIYTTRLSDHFPILSFIPQKKKKILPKYLSVRSFSNDSIDNFKAAISNLSWEEVFTSLDAQLSYNVFSSDFNDLFNNYFPEREVRFNKNIHKIEPFMTHGLLVSRQKKNKLEKISINQPTEINKRNFKQYKNKYNTIIRSAKKLYYEQTLESQKHNLRKTWQILKEAIGKKKGNNMNVPEMERNGTRINDPHDIAEYLNTHFTTIADRIAEQINPTDRPPDLGLNESEQRFSFTQFTPELLIDIVMEMQNKNSKDLDFLSNNFLKKIIPCIAKPISHIFNLSLSTGVIPSQLKCAKVVPIFKLKKSLHDEHLNPIFYRPISLLPIFSKILEKQVATNLTEYLNNFDIIYEHQYGYQKNKSTFHPMIHLMNKVSTALNRGEIAIGVFCDLQKAFDTCSHEILLKKLDKIGIKGTEKEWFANYLKDREQLVTVNGVSSTKKFNRTGVPQGSILGPLLFLIYINDLPEFTELLCLLFADDTSILITGKSLDDIITILNSELWKICTWFRANKLSLHPEKTKFMIFTQKENNICFEELNICLNYNNPDENNPDLIKKLNYVNSKSKIPAIKFLGVFLDPQLNFKYHIETLRKTLSKSLFIMKKSRNFLSEKAMTTLYFSLINCHLLYCNEIWSAGQTSVVNSLFLQQKKAIRIITNSSYNDHTEPLFKRKGILPLFDLIKLSKIKFMYDYRNNLVPKSFDQVWIRNVDRTQAYHNLRLTSNEFYVDISRYKMYESFPKYSFSKLWNDLEDALKSIESRKFFINALKTHLLGQLNYNIQCTRLFCPSCARQSNETENDFN